MINHFAVRMSFAHTLWVSRCHPLPSSDLVLRYVLYVVSSLEWFLSAPRHLHWFALIFLRDRQVVLQVVWRLLCPLTGHPSDTDFGPERFQIQRYLEIFAFSTVVLGFDAFHATWRALILKELSVLCSLSKNVLYFCDYTVL